MEKRNKTYIEDLDRGVYDIKNDFNYDYKSQSGLTEEIIREISAKKNEPEWMLNFRLESLKIYHKLDVPTWAPDISDLDIENIVTYVKPKTNLNSSWDDVPQEIKDTFERLGI